MSAQDQIFNFRLHRSQPAHFCAVHGGPPCRSVIVGARKMVKAVSDIEGQFGVRAFVLRAFTYGAFDVDDEIAGGALFARNGFTAEADDIRGMILTEKFAVVLRDASIIRQQQSDLLPDGFRAGGFKHGGEFSGQTTDCRQVDPAFLPVYQRGFHL